MADRTCLGCRKVLDKKKLIRFVSINETLTADIENKLPGRGAYICPERECLESACRKKDAFQRALKRKAAMPGVDDIWQAIKK